MLLLISILLEQYLLVRLFPWISDLGAIRPMVVFLDIPLGGPVIDLVPVGILFTFFYAIVLAPGLSRSGIPIGAALRKKLRTTLMGLTILLICILAGGGLFYLFQDALPRSVRNGIDSVGVRADVYLPYPVEGRIHLHGSMFLLLCCYAGIRIWMRMMKEEPAETTTRIHREGRKITMQVPEPVLVAEETPTPVEKRVRVLRTETGMGKGKVFPCVVDTEMVRPAQK
jgi:hypothetical protein